MNEPRISEEPGLRAILRALRAQRVDYAVFGAVALGLHGLAPATADLDLFIRPDAENVERDVAPRLNFAEASEWYPSWTPDGEHVTFSSERSSEMKLYRKRDGRWIACQSNESGDFEVYVRPFPGPGGKWQLCRGGGAEPSWAHDGSAIYFSVDDRKMMSVSVDVEGESFQAGRPTELFTRDIEFLGRWEVTADGTFVAALEQADDDTPTDRTFLTFLFKWPAELDRLVPQ